MKWGIVVVGLKTPPDSILLLLPLVKETLGGKIV